MTEDMGDVIHTLDEVLSRIRSGAPIDVEEARGLAQSILKLRGSEDRQHIADDQAVLLDSKAVAILEMLGPA